MIFFGMAEWLRLGVRARRRSHRKMFTVVTFMSPPAFYIATQKCLYLYRQELLKVGWFDVMWQETPRVEIRPGRKSWDRAEMAQTGQNYHYFPKRAENQNDQNLMVVWWYRYIYIYDDELWIICDIWVSLMWILEKYDDITLKRGIANLGRSHRLPRVFNNFHQFP